jgi:TetR/AcrR family transcriptional regulator, regulator of biofilm formation and stress response
MTRASTVERRARTPRGEARRTRILEAVLAIVGREGTGAVTHRAVAAVAGVPLAATTYYFSSRSELLADALEYAAGEDLAELERDAAEFAVDPLTAATLADHLTANVVGWLRGGRPALLAKYEISLESARRPELAAISRAWTDAYVRALEPALAKLGCPDPERDGRIVFAAVCGMVLDELAAPQPEFEQAVLRPGVERLLVGLTKP